MNAEIIQLIPANGWCAIYKDAEDAGHVFEDIHRLAAWALLSSGNVVGLEPDGPYLTVASDATNFLRYSYQGE